jgi:magnesium-transporting ATPase (P-type)
MVHFFALMLWIAGALAILAGMPQLGAAIFIVILLNGVFAFAQEYRAERASEKLRELLPRRATVVRDGAPTTIDVRQLVPGDVVCLRAGDRISADLDLVETNSLSIDVSALTGESLPIRPEPHQTVFAGTLVREGEGLGIVAATAMSTRLASIAQIAQSTDRPRTPLALELDRVVRIIAVVATSVGILFLAIAVVVGIRLTDAFLFAVGVFVALVPEGLLPTVTLSLAMGAQRMAQRHALVRRLESVETLGSTTFICTDKTGTLTLNQMAVVAAWTPTGSATIEGVGYEPNAQVTPQPAVLPALRQLAWVAARCSDGRAVLQNEVWLPVGNPMEAALDTFALRLGIDISKEERSNPITRRFPFDSRRKRMSVRVGQRLLTKGAPDHLFPLCSLCEGASEALAQMTERGYRVIAVAERQLGGEEAAGEASDLERNLTLLGLLGIEDPPRPGVASAIASCRRANIRIAMVTGDHPDTGKAIAKEVGLLGPEERVVDGKDLPDDEDVLGALMDRDGIVVGRVTPEQKLNIARALRKRGHVVAMTGDGVNDGPALQEANIGIAMGLSGADVAREAADLVLLDDNFATIVVAIEQGRTTFANTRRFLTYHLAANVAELMPFVVWAFSGGRVPLALGILQILTFDVGSDVMPALALGAEPPSERVLRTPTTGRHLLDRTVLLRAFGLLGFIESVMVMAAFFGTYLALGWRPGHPLPMGNVLSPASGAAFLALGIGQTANAFACRSTRRWPGTLGWTTNRLLLQAIAVQLLLLAAFLLIHPLAVILGQAPPRGAGFAVALLAFPAVLLADAIQKSWTARRVRAC